MGAQHHDAEALYAHAKQAANLAYVPYSGVAVGAIVLGGDGKRYVGANVANASGALTMCAERIAIYAAVLGGLRQISAVAVAHSSSAAVTSAPCGACLQVMAEFDRAGTARVIFEQDAVVIDTQLRQLLPIAYRRG